MLVPEINIDRASAMVEKSAIDADDFFTAIDSGSKNVIICPNCGRVWIKEDKGKFVPFVREGSEGTYPLDCAE